MIAAGILVLAVAAFVRGAKAGGRPRARRPGPRRSDKS